MAKLEFYFWATVAVVASLTSLTNLVLYGLDKRRARRHEWRIPEKTFHVLGLLGGWPGALVAGSLFRHKTQKLSYRLLFLGVVILHGVAVWGLWHVIRSLSG